MRTRSSFTSSPRVRRLRYRRDMRLGFPCSPHHLSVIREKIFVASRDLASATVMLLPGVPLRIDLSRIAKCGRLPEANSTSRKCLKFARIRASCNASPLSPLALREEFAPLNARFCLQPARAHRLLRSPPALQISSPENHSACPQARPGYSPRGPPPAVHTSSPAFLYPASALDRRDAWSGPESPNLAGVFLDSAVARKMTHSGNVQNGLS